MSLRAEAGPDGQPCHEGRRSPRRGCRAAGFPGRGVGCRRWRRRGGAGCGGGAGPGGRGAADACRDVVRPGQPDEDHRGVGRARDALGERADRSQRPARQAPPGRGRVSVGRRHHSAVSDPHVRGPVARESAGVVWDGPGSGAARRAARGDASAGRRGCRVHGPVSADLGLPGRGVGGSAAGFGRARGGVGAARDDGDAVRTGAGRPCRAAARRPSSTRRPGRTFVARCTTSPVACWVSAASLERSRTSSISVAFCGTC